jgi:hypothetical protein
MKTSSRDKQLGSVLPRRNMRCAQSNQITNPSKNETGLDAGHHARISPRGGEKFFFLTSSFTG